MDSLVVGLVSSSLSCFFFKEEEPWEGFDRQLAFERRWLKRRQGNVRRLWVGKAEMWGTVR